MKHVITRVVDDTDGSEDDVDTVHFALGNRRYEIDLSASNADKLHELLAPYIEAGRPAGRFPAATSAPAARKAPARADREQTVAIREWARQRGMEVNNRGRIPKPVLEAYHAEN
jgi:hypothetical protein